MLPVRRPIESGLPVATAALTSLSTHVFWLTAPSVATVGCHDVGRLFQFTPVSDQAVSFRRATLPPAGLPPLLMFATWRRNLRSARSR